MPWFRLDDSFDTHPKTLAAGNEAVGLYIRCGTYAARNLTDGFVGQEVVALYGNTELAAVLVRVRFWHRARGGFRIHDYLDYNPPREEVIHKREVRSDSGRKGGVSSGESRRRAADQRKPRSKPEANASAVASPVVEPPSRSRPGVVVVDVVGRSNGSSTHALAVIDAIIKEIHDKTGKLIDPDWAEKIAAELLTPDVTNPAAYVRTCIRNDPNPALRFLPQYDRRHARPGG